jgi:hypothetical protein
MPYRNAATPGSVRSSCSKKQGRTARAAPPASSVQARRQAFPLALAAKKSRKLARLPGKPRGSSEARGTRGQPRTPMLRPPEVPPGSGERKAPASAEGPDNRRPAPPEGPPAHRGWCGGKPKAAAAAPDPPPGPRPPEASAADGARRRGSPPPPPQLPGPRSPAPRPKTPTPKAPQPTRPGAPAPGGGPAREAAARAPREAKKRRPRSSGTSPRTSSPPGCPRLPPPAPRLPAPPPNVGQAGKTPSTARGDGALGKPPWPWLPETAETAVWEGRQLERWGRPRGGAPRWHRGSRGAAPPRSPGEPKPAARGCG